MSRARTESAGDSLCPVCHENTEIFAIGPCDHPICYRCSTRMRVLCDQTYCPICRGELPQIVHLTTRQKYDNINRRSCIPNRKYKILLEDESVEDAFQALLEHRCLVCDTRPLLNCFKTLQTHMNRTHSLFACDLCVSHLKIFPFERKFYNRSNLATHRRNGDPDNRSYRGHPLCHFCDDRYMDNDELLRHLRKSHYYCHICDANSSNNEYFDDYPDLKLHFRKAHFLCEEGQCGCTDTRFTNAFATDIDFRAHVAAEHMGNKSKAQAKELRTIDVAFQMAPRRRGRDARVVSPEDFDEVNDPNRGQRDRRQRRHNNERESYSRTENMTPPLTTEASAPPAPQPPALDDFPTLGNAPPPFVPTAAKKPDEAVEDFPSLSSNSQSRSATVTSSSLVPPTSRPGKPSASAMSQKQPNNFSTAASVISSSGPGRPATAQSHPAGAQRSTPAVTVTKQSWGAPRLSSGEDFPSLGGSKKGKAAKDGPNYVTLGSAWTKAQKTENSRPLSSKSGRDSPSGKPAPSLASLGHSLCDDGEFPSLGGRSAAKQPTWLQKNTKPAKKKSEKPSPLGNCLDRSVQKKDNGRSTQLNGTSEKWTDPPESKKKKKKQKEKETKADIGDSGISLSSIASELDAVVETSKPVSRVKEDFSEPKGSQDTASSDQTASAVSDDFPSVGNAPPPFDENDKWETVTSKKSVAFHEDDFPSLCNRSKGKLSSANEFSAETSTNKKNKPLAATTLRAFQDDFPSLSNVSEKVLFNVSSGDNASEKKSKKKTEGSKKPKSLLEDDFPELPAQTKKTKPPPGFQKAQVAAPPPGLGTQPSALGGRCPPGLNSAPSTMPSSPLAAAAIPKLLLNLQTYVLPQNEKQRNGALVSHVRQLLVMKFDGFERFCALSREFRSGQSSAVKYHKMCEDLFGAQKLLEILPELVALLPDIVKQHELAEAHRQSILGMCAPLNLMTCPTCHQYLKVEDSTVHFSSHA